MAGARFAIVACFFIFHLLLLPSLAVPSPDTECCRIRCRCPQKDSGEDALGACYRGCMLFSICHFLDVSAELNTTRAKCESACLEAYAMGPEQIGCTTGCEYHLPDLQSWTEQASGPVGPPSAFSVLDLFSSFCSNIVKSARNIISSTWTYFLQADNGKVEVIQSQTEVDSPIPELQAPSSEVTERAWVPSSPSTLKPHRGVYENLENVPSKEMNIEEKLQHAETPQPEQDFLGCMSKRSGLPRWILVACLFLSIMVMIWLSCATLATAPEQHVKTQPLSINGDQEYVDDMGKLSMLPFQPMIAVAVCPTEESDEAGPLPVKVDLDKTII
uniref:Transmembrane protein 59-like n=1 Tax=Geotrypetes seraphini TaxID=260995 RepID=A0A6P8S7G8_GEOSA|nr:transmembrane protein 59-like [Geotrypetes seraphini]